MAHRMPFLASLATMSAVAAALPALVSAQDYTQYEVQYMTVRSDQIQDFDEALAAHNQEYHSGGGPYHANVWYVANGPRTGQYVWVMGPVTFGEIGGRPAGEHDDDWAGNVMPHARADMDVSYWRVSEGLSHTTDEELHPILRVRGYRIAPGQMFRFREQRRMLKEMYEAKGYAINESVLFPRFRPEEGPDVVVVRTFDDWSDFDGGGGMASFRADFIEVHGQGAWQRWWDANGEIIEDSWDQVQVLMPELSGTN